MGQIQTSTAPRNRTLLPGGDEFLLGTAKPLKDPQPAHEELKSHCKYLAQT